jgi:hypothetical protein
MDRSKARQEKRAQALTPRRGRKPGVKVGATPLQKSAMRWEVAVYGMLVQGRLCNSPIHAAEFAASVFNKSVKVSCIEGGLCFDYTGGRGVLVEKFKVAVDGVVVVKHKHDRKKRDDAGRNRRDKILREAPRLIAGATGSDLIWLQISMQALDGLFNAVALGDETALKFALAILESKLLSWPPSVAKLFLI